jgi:hypothetical protein
MLEKKLVSLYVQVPVNFAKDALEGKDFKESAKERFDETTKDLKNIVKDHAVPVLKDVGKKVGDSLITGTRNFAKDALEGKDIKESAKERFDETTKDLKNIVKDHAVPVLKDVGKKVGDSLITGTRNFAKDALEGKDIKESAKERFDETTKDLKNIVKDHAVPVLKDVGKKVGDSLITGTRNFAKDALEGKDIKESAKERFDETTKDLKNIVKDHAVPVLKDVGKKVGDSLITGTRNFAKDALEGKDIKESAKERFDETTKDLKNIVKDHAVPVLKDVGKKVGESVLTGTTNFAKDALEGKDIKESAKERFDETTKDLKNIVKDHAVPVLKDVGKKVGDSLITGTRNFAKDALEGKDIKESAKERFDETTKDLKNIVKDHAVPVLKDVGKKVGESVLTGTTNFAKDALEGKDFKESAKERFDETTKDLKNIVKDHAVPVLKDVGKKVGDSLITGTRNFAKDALEGKDFKESAKERFDETTKDLKNIVKDAVPVLDWVKMHSKVKTLKRAQKKDLMKQQKI